MSAIAEARFETSPVPKLLLPSSMFCATTVSVLVRKAKRSGEIPRRVGPAQEIVVGILDAPLRAVGDCRVDVERETRIRLERQRARLARG